MIVASGLFALALLGADAVPAPPAPRVDYQVRVLDMKGLEWRGKAHAKLVPVARKGSATVWTADRAVVGELVGAAARVVGEPRLAAAPSASASVRHELTRHYVADVRRVADGPVDHATAVAYRPEVEALRDAFEAVVSCRQLDQGVLARVSIEDTQFAAFHTVATSETLEPKPDGSKHALTAKFQVPEVVAHRVEGEWLIPNDGVLVVSLGVHTTDDGKGRAVATERLALIEARPGAGCATEEAACGNRLPTACAIQPPAPPAVFPVPGPVAYAPVALPHYLAYIPPDSCPPLIVSPGMSATAGPAPSAVALYRAMNPAPPSAEPMPVASSTIYADRARYDAPEAPAAGPKAMPSLPGRNLPRAIGPDGKEVPLPPLPAEDLAPAAPGGDDESAEARPSPQVRKPRGSNEAPAPANDDNPARDELAGLIEAYFRGHPGSDLCIRVCGRNGSPVFEASAAEDDDCGEKTVEVAANDAAAVGDFARTYAAFVEAHPKAALQVTLRDRNGIAIFDAETTQRPASAADEPACCPLMKKAAAPAEGCCEDGDDDCQDKAKARSDDGDKDRAKPADQAARTILQAGAELVVGQVADEIRAGFAVADYCLSLAKGEKAAASCKVAEAPKPAANPEAREVWAMTLDDALRIGFDNCESARVVAIYGVGIDGASGNVPNMPPSQPLRIAPVKADACPDQFKADAMALARSIEQSYWALAAQQVHAWAYETAVDMGQRVLEREKAKCETGAGSAPNVAEASEQLERFKLMYAASTADLITTERQLRRVLGLPPADSRRVVASSEAKVGPVRIDGACVGQRIAAKLADARREAEYHALAISLGFGVSPGACVAPAEAEAVVRQMTAAVQQATHEVARAILEADANGKQFQTATRLKKAALERLQAQKASFEDGTVTIDRYLDAINRWANAVAQEADFRSRCCVAAAALAEVQGTLLDREHIVVCDPPKPRTADARVGRAAFLGAGNIGPDIHIKTHAAPAGVKALCEPEAVPTFPSLPGGDMTVLPDQASPFPNRSYSDITTKVDKAPTGRLRIGVVEIEYGAIRYTPWTKYLSEIYVPGGLTPKAESK